MFRKQILLTPKKH